MFWQFCPQMQVKNPQSPRSRFPVAKQNLKTGITLDSKEGRIRAGRPMSTS